MKKTLLVLTVACFMFTSCATVFGGRISDCQKTKPAAGQPSRQIRIVPLILDCGGFIWLIVDFADGAIYKPCSQSPKK